MSNGRILHTMLRVGDLDRSIEFYTNVMGMNVLRRNENKEYEYTLAFLGYGDESQGAVIELTYNWGTSEYDLGNAFGHVAIDKINPGEWFAKQFSKKINADKVLIQKSGYFSRSSKANKNDLELIFKSVELAVDIVLDNGESGVVGLDEDNNNQLNCIKFERIKGGKAFDYNVDWFQSILKEIKQI